MSYMTWVPFRGMSLRLLPSLMDRGLHTFVAIAFVAVLNGTQLVKASPSSPPMIVFNDKGGDLKDRVALIRRLELRGQRVEIRGGYCLSACTMYLGLSETCVSPEVKFGFHGPSSQTYGISLSPKDFEYWSQTMASYYPDPLRRWFLHTGRNITVGFYEISGENVIKLGVSKCS